MKKKLLILSSFVLFIALLFSISGFWWNSWQDWNDDFEDDYINQTFWDNETEKCKYGGVLNGELSLIENSSGSDGFVLSNITESTGSGSGVAAINWMRTKQDYNDSKNYHLNISVNASNTDFSNVEGYEMHTLIGITNETDLAISGVSCTEGWIYNDVDVLRIINPGAYFEVGEMPMQDYDLVIDSTNNNFSLYNNSDGSLLNYTTSSLDEWYIAVIQFLSFGAEQYQHGYFYLSNYTSLALLSIDTSLLSPDNATTENTKNPYFAAEFNMSVESYNVTNTTLYIWETNGTEIYTSQVNYSHDNSGETANLTTTLPYRSFLWNYESQGTDGSSNVTDWGDTNRTLTLNDTIAPQYTIISPASSISSADITINISVEEDSSLDYCEYNITKGAATEKVTTTFDLSDLYLNDTYTLSGEGTYVVNYGCNDSNGNLNYTTYEFTYSLPVSGGSTGGGGTTVVVSPEGSWEMSTEGEGTRYQLNMILGSSRTKYLYFENIGDTSRTITLSCEKISEKEDLCPYITFDETSFELPLIKDVKVRQAFTIDIPKELDKDDYFANIVANDGAAEGTITTEVNLELGLFSQIGTKLISKTNSGIPYFLIFFFTIAISGSLAHFVIIKPSKLPGGVSTIVGMVIGFIVLLLL